MANDVLDRLRSALAGRYTIERELGRGGMAVVYLAHDERHDRVVAIKVMLPEVVGDDGVERFRREIHLAARLSHPNILPVFDSGDAAGLFYYVMPYVDGESLSDVIARERLLGVAETVAIVRQVADALEYAHSQGVVHRDIKPANILITRARTRGAPHAVVTDFGIARALSGTGATRLTATGLMIGTPAYMSPEQWGGESPADGRSDQYSLACVFYEMLIGEPPFTGATPMIVLARQSMEMVPSMRIARPGITEALEAVVNRAMEKVPGDRHPSVAAFADAIDEAAAPIILDSSSASSVSRAGSQEALRAAETRPLGTPSPASPQSAAVPRHRAWRRFVIPAGITAALVAAGLIATMWTGPDAPGRTRILVRPFEDRGQSDSTAFGEGLTEEIINRLSGVSGLGVVARTSAMKYKGTTLTAREIGRELNVDHLVEGSVTYLGGASRGARVSVSLVRAEDDEAVWSDDFEVATLDDLYRAQAKIATEVAARLAVRFDSAESRRLSQRPTTSRDAYDAYLAGNKAYNRSWDSSDVKAAISKYEEAARLDPTFAVALAALGRSHGWMFQLGLDPTPKRLTLAKQAIDSALRLAPNLTEAHIALGLYYYWSARDYERALEEFRVVRRSLPGSAEVHNYMGNLSRRKGDWGDAIESYRLAAELDPRSHQTLFNRAEALLYVRRYDEAEMLVDRVIEIAPDFVDGFILKATLQIHRLRDAAAAGRILEQTAARIPVARWRAIGHHWRAGLFRIVDTDPASSERRIALGSFGLDTAHYLISKAEAYRRFGRQREAAVYFDSAAAYMEATVKRHPEWASAFGRLGLAYAGLGRTEDAPRLAQKAVDMLPVARDALDGPEWVVNVARVYAMLGDSAKAMDWLERAMRAPSRLSPAWLEMDPVWAPLRADARFQRLVRDPPPLNG